ncbi:hypothetical protein GCU67_08125 [Modestobacter muralis]|uniref:Uncharacterized protein n=1 Tax=Modestobacter muralis TaxID=1608614 RepID=A0A6P0H4Z8_9ACTN|nr:hypothetical protein [Modestobacter muralis]NEK94141.1 hypothetical protein [Modestobacter muralis]NEN50908.1 hypothetical protein [Modestobacter muralis]
MTRDHAPADEVAACRSRMLVGQAARLVGQAAALLPPGTSSEDREALAALVLHPAAARAGWS